MGCGCDPSKLGDSGPIDSGPTESGPTAFVQLRVPGGVCGKRNGVQGMVALIKSGDRHTNADIIQHRCCCRGCPKKRMVGQRAVCAVDDLALHWKTAVGSYDCEEWHR